MPMLWITHSQAQAECRRIQDAYPGVYCVPVYDKTGSVGQYGLESGGGQTPGTDEYFIEIRDNRTPESLKHALLQSHTSGDPTLVGRPVPMNPGTADGNPILDSSGIYP